MPTLTWQHQGQTYTAHILDYIALITEQANKKFMARLESSTNTVLHEWPGEPSAFEEVEQWFAKNQLNHKLLRSLSCS